MSLRWKWRYFDRVVSFDSTHTCLQMETMRSTSQTGYCARRVTSYDSSNINSEISPSVCVGV